MLVIIDQETFSYGLPYIAQGLMLSGLTSSGIESIYATDSIRYKKAYIECLSPAKESLFGSGTFSREQGLKHCLGVIFAAESDCILKEKIIKNFERSYKDLSETARKHPNHMLEFALKNGDKNSKANEEVTYVGYYLLQLYHGWQFEASESTQKYINLIEKSLNDRKAYDDPQKSFQGKIDDHIQEISNILKDYKFVTSCSEIMSYNDIIDGLKGIDSQAEEIPMSMRYALRDIYNLFSGLLDFKNMSFSLLLRDCNLNKKELQAIGLKILAIRNTDKEDNNIVFDKYTFLYINGIILTSFIKEYIAAKNLCFDVIDKETLSENKALYDKVKDLQAELNKRQNQINTLMEEKSIWNNNFRKEFEEKEASFYRERQELHAKLKSYEQKEEQWEYERYKLGRLQELAYELSEDIDEPTVVSKDVHSILEKNKIYVCGGGQNWHNILHKKYPNLIIISGVRHSVDPIIFKSADYVLFYSGHMVHTVFDKVQDFLFKNKIPFSYIPRLNIASFEERVQAADTILSNT